MNAFAAFDPDPAKPFALLKHCPVYEPTPLITLTEIGNSPVFAKIEANRMGLGAFKALGGVYAVAVLISDFWQETGKPALTPQDYASDDVRTFANTLTFVCASAGNHGMAVASGARLFGAKARIHLANTVPEEFATRLREKGAEVVRSGSVYEESIAAAIADCDKNGTIHLADGTWPGYTAYPRLIMEGYTVMAEEMRHAWETSGEWPKTVYLQAGVGGLAAANAVMIRRNWKVQPEIVTVEPEAAPCIRDSVKAGKPVTVEGPTSTMGRLDCKEPSIVALDTLAKMSDRFVTVSDEAAANAAAFAASKGFPSTPSGAAGLAACFADNKEKSALVILSEGAL